MEQDGNGIWWLRTMGSDNKHATYVNTLGIADKYGTATYNDYFYSGVRPAIWVDLSESK